VHIQFALLLCTLYLLDLDCPHPMAVHGIIILLIIPHRIQEFHQALCNLQMQPVPLVKMEALRRLHQANNLRRLLQVRFPVILPIHTTDIYLLLRESIHMVIHLFHQSLDRYT
jgi:hypothetical protein